MPPAKRVTLLLPSLTALGGGIELYLQQFTDALVRNWPDIELHAILARECKLARPERLSPAVRARLTVSGPRTEKRAMRIAELMRAIVESAVGAGPDLVVCGHVNYAAVSWALAKRFGASLCALTYGFEAWDLRGTNALLLRRADRVIGISRFTCEHLVGRLGVKPENVAVVHNAVDINRFFPGSCSPEILDELATMARPILLTVCRLDAGEGYKGVDIVIEALARNPDLAGSYLVVGDGTDRQRLVALAKERGVPVRFFGRASDAQLPDIYRACDLFVMPSRREGFGYVFIEAMACGVPVVAGGIDGSVDALADGELGLLVDPTSPEEVAVAIRAQLQRTTPLAMRDPAHMFEEVKRRFSQAAFDRRVGQALSPFLSS